MTHKRDLSERDICTQFIQPALLQAGWTMETQVREEVSFTDGRIDDCLLCGCGTCRPYETRDCQPSSR